MKSIEGKPGDHFQADLAGEDWPDGEIRRDPPRRKWFSVALSLILTAVAAEMVSKWYVGRGVTKLAEVAQATSFSKQYLDQGMDDFAQFEADQAAKLKTMAFQSIERSAPWSVAGLGLFVFALGCWAVSGYRREGGSSVLLLGLVIGYVLLLMLMI